MSGLQDNRVGLEAIPVWSPTVRAWHWLLATSVIAGWMLGEFRTFSIMQWHFYAGYCTIGLLVFRIGLGFIGPDPVRFATLLRSLRHIGPYLKSLFRREPSGMAGHAPLGALASLVFLLLLIVQATSGLFSEDDGLFYEGPLSDLLSSDGVRTATSIHNNFAQALLVMFGLHLAAMLFYGLWKRENLVKPMLTGIKLVRSNNID